MGSTFENLVLQLSEVFFEKNFTEQNNFHSVKIYQICLWAEVVLKWLAARWVRGL